MKPTSAHYPSYHHSLNCNDFTLIWAYLTLNLADLTLNFAYITLTSVDSTFTLADFTVTLADFTSICRGQDIMIDTIVRGWGGGGYFKVLQYCIFEEGGIVEIV